MVRTALLPLALVAALAGCGGGGDAAGETAATARSAAAGGPDAGRRAAVEVRAERDAFVDSVRVEPWPGEPGPDGGGRPGLRCRYYEGAWERLPDFAPLVPAREGEVAEVGIPAWSRAEDVGVVQSGYLRAPRRGTYRLTLWSDDGAALLVGDRIVAINDGLHGRTAVVAELPLAAGLHRLEVRWFQHLGGRALELWWSGPGIEPQAVPAEALRH